MKASRMYVRLVPFGKSIGPVPLTADWREMTYEEAAKITDGKHWRIVPNPDYRPPVFVAGLVSDPGDPRKFLAEEIPPTAEELAAQKAAEVKAAFEAIYPLVREMELQARAIDALTAGEKPPQEYLDYRAARAKAWP